MHGDARFLALSKPQPNGQTVFERLIHGPMSNGIGLYQAGPMALAESLGWPAKGFAQAFAEVIAQGMVVYCEEHHMVFLPNFLKHNPPGSTNVAKNWVRLLDSLPQCHLISEWIKQFKAFAQAFPQAFRVALPEAVETAYGTACRTTTTTTTTTKEPIAAPSEPHGLKKWRRTNGTDPNIKILLDFYHDTYLAIHKTKPVISGGKDGAICRKLLAGRTIEEARWIVEEHLKHPPDLYERKNLYGLNHVLAAANTILARKDECR